MDSPEFIAALADAGLHLVTPGDVFSLATCAASGYKDYPLFNYFCGGSYDEERAFALWNVLLRSLPKDAVCYADSPEVGGFAIWLPASYRGTSVFPFLAAGGFKLPFLMDPGVFARLLRYDNYAQSIRLNLTKGEGWYFYNLVTRADRQGKGIGGSLVRPAFELMDKHGEQVYLETHDAANVPLYEHYGFRLMEQSVMKGKTPLLHYAMLRNPV